MKISEQTFDIMKNFSSINSAMMFREPKILKTLSLAENIIGIYDTEEKFPEFQFYNSGPFMSIVNLFGLENIDFDFTDAGLIIKAGKENEVRIGYDDEDMIPKIGKLKKASNYKKAKDFDAEFKLTAEQINKIQKAANILGLPDMTVQIKSGKGFIAISDDEDPDSNSMKIKITEGKGDAEVNMMVKNLIILPGDYTISVMDDRMTKFKHKDLPLFYIVAAKAV